MLGHRSSSTLVTVKVKTVQEYDAHNRFDNRSLYSCLYRCYEPTPGLFDRPLSLPQWLAAMVKPLLSRVKGGEWEGGGVSGYRWWRMVWGRLATILLGA